MVKRASSCSITWTLRAIRREGSLPALDTHLRGLLAQTPLHTGLAIFAVLTSVIAGYIHLRVVKVIYFDVEKRPANVQLQGRYGMHALLSINGALLVVFGILPAGLLYLCEQVVLNMLRHMSGMS